MARWPTRWPQLKALNGVDEWQADVWPATRPAYAQAIVCKGRRGMKKAPFTVDEGAVVADFPRMASGSAKPV